MDKTNTQLHVAFLRLARY